MANKPVKKNGEASAFARFKGPWLRVIVPAVYCALILVGAFSSIEEISVFALVALGGYTLYMAWRIYAIYEERLTMLPAVEDIAEWDGVYEAPQE